MVLNMSRFNVTKPVCVYVLLATFVIMVCYVSLVNVQLKGISIGQCSFSKGNVTGENGLSVPLRIHQLFFDVGHPMPRRFHDAAVTWRLHNPRFQYTLWNKSMVDELINVNYPEIRELFDSYDHWVNRVDVARYLILYHYGGVFVDMDIKSRNDITEFLAKMSSECLKWSKARG